MIKEAGETMVTLEKVFIHLTNTIAAAEVDNFKECGYSGLKGLLELTDKTFALQERIATKLRKRSWE